jgi:UDP-3-O-[3-hydroxymyristoyl] glucosamine N-acyltransferase
MDHDSYTIVGVMPRSFAFNDIAGVGDITFHANPKYTPQLTETRASAAEQRVTDGRLIES